MLLSLKHATLNCMNQIDNDNIHQGPKTIFWWWEYPFISMHGKGKGGETFFCTWGPLYNAIATTVSQSVSWATMHSLPHKWGVKWIVKSSMI